MQRTPAALIRHHLQKQRKQSKFDHEKPAQNVKNPVLGTYPDRVERVIRIRTLSNQYVLLKPCTQPIWR